MPGTFFDSFNVSLPDMETQFTEDWSINGATWPAIAVATLDEDHHIIKGGTILAAHVHIIVRDEVFDASGVTIGSFVSTRGIDLFVNAITSDGDASKTLACTPKGIDLWR